MKLKLRASYRDTQSLAFKLRKRRMAFFSSLLEPLEKPIRLLDIGGTANFWKTLTRFPDDDVHITLLNIEDAGVSNPHMDSVAGDARSLPFDDKSFEVVFSNSVIEHVGSDEDRERMANEVRRVGHRYFIQTPNRYFPIEPHFFFPLFQFLPFRIQVWLLSHLRLGRSKRVRWDRESAAARAAAIRLLSGKDLRRLFPGAAVYEERICGIVKSFAAYHGWGTLAEAQRGKPPGTAG